MSAYTQRVIQLRSMYDNKKAVEQKIRDLAERVGDLTEQHDVMMEASQLIASISDSNTVLVLDYITGIINKALKEIFPYDERRIYLEKKMHNDQYAHINVKLITEQGRERDLQLQTGTGLRQIISFLFVVSLIEVRKGRRLLIMDALFSGLHAKAKSILMDIIKIFAEEGFQFIFVEYGVNDTGKIYLVEKPDSTATVNPLGSDASYNNEVFIFNRPLEDVSGEFYDRVGTEDEIDFFAAQTVS